jgi:uncharacterized protein (DUF1919 family)
MTYGTKLTSNHLNAKAFGLCGKVDGVFHYFDRYNNKINIGDVLDIGNHEIKVMFVPTDLKNYKSTTVVTKHINVLPSKRKSTKSHNLNIINIDVTTHL